MTDLDVTATGRLEGGIEIPMTGRNWQHYPYVKFRGVCGAHGYFASADFRDREGHGGGATPREAMRSMAKTCVSWLMPSNPPRKNSMTTCKCEITDGQIRELRRKHPEMLDTLMVAIHSTDKELRLLARAEFAKLLPGEST